MKKLLGFVVVTSILIGCHQVEQIKQEITPPEDLTVNNVMCTIAGQAYFVVESRTGREMTRVPHLDYICAPINQQLNTQQIQQASQKTQ